jgi:hypothetical protein
MESLEQSLTAVPRDSTLYGDNYRAHQGSRSLVRWAYKEENEAGLPKLCVAKVTTIANVVVAIPDSAPPEDDCILLDPSRRPEAPYLFLVPPSSWNLHYQEIMEEHKRWAARADRAR